MSRLSTSETIAAGNEQPISIAKPRRRLKLAPCLRLHLAAVAQDRVPQAKSGEGMMLNVRAFIGSLAVAATLAGASACSRTNELGGEIAPANAVGVHVVNQNFLDVDVYAVSAGVPTRLGTVTGNTVKDFLVNPSLATTDLRLVATPIGGNGRGVSGPLVAAPGQTIEFRVGSFLPNSSAFIVK